MTHDLLQWALAACMALLFSLIAWAEWDEKRKVKR